MAESVLARDYTDARRPFAALAESSVLLRPASFSRTRCAISYYYFAWNIACATRCQNPVFAESTCLRHGAISPVRGCLIRAPAKGSPPPANTYPRPKRIRIETTRMLWRKWWILFFSFAPYQMSPYPLANCELTNLHNLRAYIVSTAYSGTRLSKLIRICNTHPYIARTRKSDPLL